MSGPTPSFLIIHVSRIGDTLFATPAIRAVTTAYPTASITVLGHPKRMEVLQGLPGVNTVGRITKRRAPWRGYLRRQRYQYALVYGFDRALVAYALRVAERVVAFRQGDAALDQRLYRCVEPPAFQSEHAVLQLLRLPGAIGIPPAGLRLGYRVLPAETLVARNHLAADVPAAASPLIGLQIASFPTKPYRDWPVEQFAALARRIWQQWPHAHFLLYGGGADRTRTLWLKNQLGTCATNYAGRLTLRETAAVMSLTDLYIGVDTGPTHLMSALDIPLVGLYHCLSSSAFTGPLEHPYFCAVDHPRLRAACTEDSPMAEIAVDTVFAQVARALREHAPRAPAERLP